MRFSVLSITSNSSYVTTYDKELVAYNNDHKIMKHVDISRSGNYFSSNACNGSWDAGLCNGQRKKYYAKETIMHVSTTIVKLWKIQA